MTASNGFMGRDAFLAAGKRRYTEVTLPSGGKARIRSITEGEWAALDLKNLNRKTGRLDYESYKYSDARLIALCVVDHDGNAVFGERDLDEIMGFDTSFIRPLRRAILEHCGLSGDVEAAEKNLNVTGDAGAPCTSSAPPAQAEGTA